MTSPGPSHHPDDARSEGAYLEVDMLGSSEALFRVLTAHTPVGVFVSNAEGQCVYVNERWCELAGLTGEHALAADDRGVQRVDVAAVAGR